MRLRNSMKRRQLGQGMSEYIIITALVAVAGIGLFAAFGDTLSNQMAAMSQEMAGSTGDSDIANARARANEVRSRAEQNETLGNYTQRN